MKIYISGKISGIENEAPKIFQECEDFLMSKGHEVVNPMKLNHDHDKSWLAYMKEDIKAMMECDAICMLSNYPSSNGAKIELQLAMSIGMNILYN